MQESTLHLALEILNPKKDGVQKLKSKLEDGIHLFEKNEDGKVRLFIYPINGNLVDFLTLTAEDLGIDTVRFSINWIDTNTNRVYTSQLIKKIEQVEAFNGTFELFDTTEVEDYLTGNPKIVEQEEATLVEDGSGGTAPSSANVKEDEAEEGNKEDLPTQESQAQKLLKEYEAKTSSHNKAENQKDGIEDQQQMDEKINPSTENIVDYSQSDDLLADIPDSFKDNSNNMSEPNKLDEDLLNDIPDDFEDEGQYEEVLDGNDDDKEPDDVLSKDEMASYIFDDSDDAETNSATGMVISDNLSVAPSDPLMKAAIESFNKVAVGDELPAFDHETQDLIRPSYVQAVNNIANAKAKAINYIYDVLKETYDREYDEALNNAVANAKKEHDKNVKQIRQNLQTEIDQLQQNIKDDYDKRKREAGQSYLNEFYAKYDKEHLHEIAENVSEQSKSLSTKATTDISVEDNDLYKYIKQVKDSIFKHVTENVDIDYFIENYKNTVNFEKNHLVEEVKAIRNENNELKKQVKDLQSALTIQKQTEESRVKAEVAQQVNKATFSFRKQVEDSDKRRQKAEAEVEKEKAKTAEIQNKNQEITQKLSDMAKNLSQIQLADKIKQDTARDLLGNNQAIPQATIQYQQPSVQPSVPQNQEDSKKKLSLTDKVLIGVATLFAGIGIFSSVIMYNTITNTPRTEQTAATNAGTTVTSDSVTSSDDSNSKSFVYTAKDGKKYKVTKDSKNSGHYVDGDGNYHTVLFNNK